MAVNKTRSISESISDDNEASKKIKKIVSVTGIALILMGAILFILSFGEILLTEAKFKVYDPIPTREVAIGTSSENVKTDKKLFLNPNFGIYIPRIGANAKVVPDVDPYNYSEYTKALETGVAHAKTSVKPGQNGNIFLFAHSAVNFYESKKFNVYFYLLPKLKKRDKVYLSYKNKLYTYEVEQVQFVSKEEIRYLSTYKDYNTLTLMTCWPAGLNIKRVIVTAKEI